MTSAATEFERTKEKGLHALRSGKWIDATSAFRLALNQIKDEGGSRADEMNRIKDQCEIRNKLAHCLRMMGQIDEARREFEKAKEEAEISDQEDLLGEALLGLGFVAWRKIELEKSRDYFKKAMDIAKKTHDLEMEGLAWSGMGCVALYYRHLDEGVEALENALDLLESMPGTEHEKGRCLHNLGFMYFKMGKLDKALEVFDACLSHCKKMGELHTMGFVYANKAHLAIKRGELEGVAELLEKSGHLLARTNDKIGLNLVRWVRGLLRYQEGDLEAALDEYWTAKRGFTEMGLLPQVFHLTIDYLPVFKDAGKNDTVKDIFSEVKVGFKRKGYDDLMDKVLEAERRVHEGR